VHLRLRQMGSALLNRSITKVDVGTVKAAWKHKRAVVDGWLEYGRCPSQRDRWGGPFNGQSARRHLVEALIANCRSAAIIETGTFQATTTEYLATTGLPVFTIESDPRNFGFSLRRTWWRRNVNMRLCDSRAGLRSLLDGPLQRHSDRNLLFYLDAHWQDDLPLAEEIDIIFSRCPNATVLVDDFEVPGDPGYGFDNYGNGNSLNHAYIAEKVRAYALSVFYPSIHSSDDDGLRRGCVVLLGKATTSIPALSSIAQLRML
jgi:hypothetical protein